MRNLITDVPGVRVGHAAGRARSPRERPSCCSTAPPSPALAALGGAPALRDGHLLAPEMTVETVDAFALSGGSAYGLDAASGAMAYLAERGRGFDFGADARADLPDGGAVRSHPRRRQIVAAHALRRVSATPPPPRRARISRSARPGRAMAPGPTTSRAGSARRASSRSRGFVVGALAAVNCAGRVTRGTSPHFWAASYEQGDEFGGLGEGPPAPDRLDFALTSDHARARPRWPIVATDARFDKARMTRIAIMASAGFGARRSGRRSGPATATSCSPPRPAAPPPRPIFATSPRSARWPPNASPAPSRAASMPRRRCPATGSSRAGATAGAAR